jgi:aspartate/glutamate racemase
MMDKRIVLVHTMPLLVDVFAELCAELLPGVKVFHVLDEPILEYVRLSSGLDSEAINRLLMHVDMAGRIGAEAVLVTCSTLSPAVGKFRSTIPVFRIDEAMVERAVESGTRIGVVVTNPTTLEPTREALLNQAALLGKQITIEMVLVENALPALLQGDGMFHDRLVIEAIDRLSEHVDEVVLAQASMARVLEALPEAQCRVLILTSPHTALARVGQYLSSLAGSGSR